MKSYAERKVFSAQARHVWEETLVLVGSVISDECRCHELARAVQRASKFNHMLVVQDGKCGPVEHSWLAIKGQGAILDVYRPGVLPQVLLVDLLVGPEYKAGEDRTDIDWTVVTELTRQMKARR